MTHTATLTPADILNLPMRENDADAATIRDYLLALLTRLWETTDQFSGKRPWGNSGWDYDLYRALTDSGHIDSDEDGYPLHAGAAHGLIQSAIAALGTPTAASALGTPASAAA